MNYYTDWSEVEKGFLERPDMLDDMYDMIIVQDFGGIRYVEKLQDFTNGDTGWEFDTTDLEGLGLVGDDKRIYDIPVKWRDTMWFLGDPIPMDKITQYFDLDNNREYRRKDICN